MEGFTYTNIFETKGIEYLVIIGFFAVLIPFWILLNRKIKPAYNVQKSKGFSSAGVLQLPQGIFFSKYHTWVHLEKNGEAKVGLDDLILHLTGEVSVECLKTPGEDVGKGELLARIRHNGRSLEIASPVSGKVSGANELLSENPNLIKNDPYQQGWIYSIKPSDWKADTDSCYLAENAVDWAKTELVRVKDFLAASSSKIMSEPIGMYMQDGGELSEKALTHFPQEVWKEFQKSFLF